MKKSIIAVCIFICTFTSCDLFFSDVSGYFKLPDPEVIIPTVGLEYELLNTGAQYTVKAYTNDPPPVPVFIPEMYSEKPVTEIKREAFYGNKNITTVVIPSTITTIWEKAFEDSSLEYIIVPRSVTTISETAFTNCLGGIYLEHDIFPGGNIGGKSAYTKDKWYKVTFHAMEGSNVPPLPVLISDNVIKILPAEPTRTGYDFQGWFLSSTGEIYHTQVTEGFVVTRDITVYAKWQ